MHKSAQIQGLRAIAVLLVLLFHAGWLPAGYIGVDIFYVISGFLITGLILRDTAFSFKSFYTRRAKRLLPAAYLVLTVTSLLFLLVAPILSRVQYSKDLFSSIWYFSNYNFAFWQNDYQNLGAEPSPLIHFWSLAVEEQFYIFWPILIVLFKRRIKPFIWIFTLASFLLSSILTEILPIWSFYSLPTRAFELGIGGLLAIHNWKSKHGNLGAILIIASLLLFDQGTYFPGLPALLPTLGALLIITSSKFNILFTNLIFQKIGDWSYSIYLWHWPLLVIPVYVLDRPLNFLEKFLALVLTFILAGATFKFVENPVRRSSLSTRSTLIIVLAIGAILSILAFWLYSTGKNAGEKINLSKVRAQPTIYQEGCQLDKAAIKPNPNCIFGNPQGERKVVLLGDSHAAQWFPAIEAWAIERGYRLIIMTKSSCPASNLSLKDDGAFKASVCNQFRKNAISEINKIDPDLLIVGSAENRKTVAASDYRKLPKFLGSLLVIKDTPWPNRDIPSCVAENLNSEKCDTPRPTGIDYGGLDTFDPIPLLCNATSCPAILNGVIAYRDHSHISVEMALKLRSDLAEKLDSLMAR